MCGEGGEGGEVVWGWCGEGEGGVMSGGNVGGGRRVIREVNFGR